MPSKSDLKLFEGNQDILDYLKQSRIFGHLPEDLLKKLIPLSQIKSFPKGSKILEEGQQNDQIFFLIRGEVSVYMTNELILTLQRIGDLFGEMSIIDDKPVLATVIALTTVDVFIIKAGDIGSYKDLNPLETQNILFRVFAKVLTEKLFLTTHKAKQYEIANRRLLDTEYNLDQLRKDLEIRVEARTSELKQSNALLQKEITEHKQTEKQLRESNQELTNVNTQLKSTQAQLVQSAKLSSLGEMATGVAHEINQPLSSISLTAGNLIEDLEDDIEEDTIPRLKKIVAMVERASKIINHMRVFGRDASTIKYSKIDLNQIIEDSFILLNERLRLNSIEIVKNLSDKLPPINCNQIQIEQVLTNLLNNARDAVETSNEKKIYIRSYQKENWVCVEIKDTGSGIPEEILPKIFDPFFTTKSQGKGTGLGLSISYGIISDHKGELEVKSQPGQGSTFWIRFPTDKQTTLILEK